MVASELRCNTLNKQNRIADMVSVSFGVVLDFDAEWGVTLFASITLKQLRPLGLAVCKIRAGKHCVIRELFVLECTLRRV